MIYIDYRQTDASLSLAAEEYVLHNYTKDEYLMLWRSSPSVIVGKFQNAFGEVSMAAAEQMRVPVIRRNSGGGTVYHDLGNLNFTFFADKGEQSPDYGRFLEPMAEALNYLGVPARMGESFDLTVHGKKISGNAQSVVKDRVMHHGTLLFDSDLSAIERLTGHASSAVRSKGIKSNPAEVENIRPYLRDDIRETDIEGFAQMLKTLICGEGCHVHRFDKEEERAIASLAETKYRTWEWNYGKSPKFTKTCGDFSVNVEAGIIASVTGCDELDKLLRGVRLKSDEILKAIPKACPSRDKTLALLIE